MSLSHVFIEHYKRREKGSSSTTRAEWCSVSTVCHTVKKQDLLFLHTVNTSRLSLFDVREQESACAELGPPRIIDIFILFDQSQLRLSGGHCPSLQPCCEGKNGGKSPLEFQLLLFQGHVLQRWL